MFGSCMENVYALRYEQCLARLTHSELTTASDSVTTRCYAAAAADDDDDDDVSMTSDHL